ncbi:MAG: hypothetical protein NTX79_00510 [Candidatus Micrarchaeota archaeon]|nr:hypothetical protein [Candidatus Micrarchaeota archaeon]
MAENKGASGSIGAPASNAPERSLKLKISKKAYVFDVRKKFAATRSFAVKKKAETPAEGIRDGIQSFLKARKPLAGGSEAGGASSAPAPAGQPSMAPGQPSASPAKPSGSLGIAVKITVALFLLFFLSIAVLMVMYGGPQGGVPASAAPPGFIGTYSSSLQQSSILSVGQAGNPSRLAYFLISFESENVTRANFSANLFREMPLTQVFLLDHARESADTYPLFRTGLAEQLSSQGISVNEIGLESLPSLPDGALLVVPTGYFPLELLAGDEGSNFKSLLSRGVGIAYIGMPFDTLALDKSGSTVKVENSGISFVKGSLESSDGFMLYDAQYTATPGRGASNMSSQGMLYGSVSTVRLGKGTMLFIPQFLDGGWVTDSDSQGYEKAVADVSRLIYEERWLSPIASAEASTNSTSEKEPVSLYTSSFPDDSAFVRLSTKATDANGVPLRTFSVFQIDKAQKGEIYPRDPQTVPFYLSGVKTRLNLALKESDPTPVKLFVGMYKDGVELQRSEFELGLTNPTIEKSVDFQVDAEPGNYVLEIIDPQGKVYAATMLTVTDLDISLPWADWVNGKFNFTISAGGRPVSPQSLSVAMDKAGERQYSPPTLARSGSDTQLTYSYAGKIAAGKHKFTFSAGRWSKDFEAEYFARKNLWDNPTVVFLGVLSLLVFGVGTVLRRPEVLRYGLDIPDFPPLNTVKIPVKRETVLEIFDNINAGYSWKWMPLRAEELKGGFRKLTYNGKPILIGDFNLERVLSKLREEGSVKDELDYWGKTAWEKESGHSTRYLMIYRILRNVFVNNAVKFSKIDAMPECDVKAVSGNEDIYFHIMEEPRERVTHRALATVPRGHTIIVFKTPEEAEDFRLALNSPSKLAVALKMEVNNRNILLLPIKEAVSAYLKEIAR